jgi:rubrerythrin
MNPKKELKKRINPMMYEFNAHEIFEMAEQIERNGAAFYKSASKATDEASAKDFLLSLYEMELEHEKTFARLKAELTDKEKTPTVFDPAGESAQYLNALAGTRVFFEKEIDISSIKEVLKSALTAEKDSIVFYLGMKDMVSGKHGKDKIDQIIREEMDHIKLLGHRLIGRQ